MSKLRKKLQQARHQYQHQRYPGDLANDLLGGTDPAGRADVIAQLTPAKKPSHWMRNLSLAAVLALAATAGIVLISSQDKSIEEVAIVTTDDPTVANPPTTKPDDGTPSSQTTIDVDEETQVEERWSLVPTGLASVQDTSFSLVPSLAYESTSVEAAEDQTVQ